MRDRDFWFDRLASRLRKAWPADAGPPRATRLCRVELGLYLLELLCPGQPAIAAWTLLGGYPFALVRERTPERERMLRVARHLLWMLRRRRVWERALAQYASFPEEVRGYLITDLGEPAVRQSVSIAADRWDLYTAALTSAPRFHRRKELPLAQPGRSYRFPEGKLLTSVLLPRHLTFVRGRPHPLEPSPHAGEPLRISRAELLETARWMDEKLGITDPRKTWYGRVDRVELDILDPDGRGYSPSELFTVAGRLHLVGMVGAGKSTLRDVVTVWAARQGRRVTIVVGDVAEQLTLVELFSVLGLRVAPVLGTSTRARNAQNAHRRLANRGAVSLLTHDARRFRHLSTACPLDALRGTEAARPLDIAEAPCTRLFAPEPRAEEQALPFGPDLAAPGTPAPQAGADTRADAGKPGSEHGCPLWGECPRQLGARELVDADIWVANPASLLYGMIPRHQNRERARFMEVACLRSDLIIVDEADRVQMQLDSMFVPSATLVGRSPDSWLDELQAHTTSEFSRTGRSQLSSAEVDRWSSSLTASIAATNRLYSMLMRYPRLRAWVQADYFSTWTLQQKLVEDWFRDPAAPAAEEDGEADLEFEEDIDEDDDPDERLPSVEEVEEEEETDPRTARRTAVVEILDAFRDDPLGDNRPERPELSRLVRLTHDLLHTLDEDRTRARATETLRELAGIAPGTGDELAVRTLRFEFTLLLGVLQQRLDVLTELWPSVEATLNLESTDNQLSRRPPLDYGPLVPESPMGNILGFQFLTENAADGQPDSGSAVLRFFRCAGVGRALLTGLHEVAALDGGPTPHVLLMSGTSWAGTAAGAHVLAPVGAILKPSPMERRALQRTSFRKLFVPGPDGRPLHLSGTRPDRRPKVLELMLDGLARPRNGKPQSDFDEELSLIDNPKRRRLLLLVGSYEEARRGTQLLNGISRWKGKVCRLVPDDAELEVSYGGAAPGDPDPAVEPMALRRGEVSAFATTGAEILIAPLMSVERGHNILNDVGQAAIGSVFFLARPHPRPHDIGLAVQSINSWVTRLTDGGGFAELVSAAPDLNAAGRTFRRTARGQWRHLLTREMAWRRLNDVDKTAFTWDRLVVMWQVIGRLVRGGVPARVVFVDSRFAEREAAGRGPDTYRSGLLASMVHVLAPYFHDETVPANERQLVQTLYGPLYQALKAISPYRPDAQRRAARGDQ